MLVVGEFGVILVVVVVVVERPLLLSHSGGWNLSAFVKLVRLGCMYVCTSFSDF